MDVDSTLDLIKGRRTNLRVDRDRPVDESLIAALCGAAVWAPNHKLTEPWRFAVVSGIARQTLGDIATQGLVVRGATDPARLENTRVKYLRAPVVVVVGCAPSEDPIRQAEDRAAVAAGIQNLLLAATAAGLASYWGTGLAAQLPETSEFCEFEPGTEIMGTIYLGWPIAEAPGTARNAPIITWISDG